MDYDGFGRKLSKDEQAVLDHVTGLTDVLSEPSGEPCEDRQYVGELMAMRSRLGAMAIEPPRMRLTFDDVLDVAGETPESPRESKVIYWITGRWGVGLVTAASVCLAVLTGAVATGELRSLYEGNVPAATDLPDSPVSNEVPLHADSPVIPARRSSLTLQHDNPAELQRVISEIVTSAGGRVTGLTRQGSGEDVSVRLAADIPAGEYPGIRARVEAFGEVVSETDVPAPQVDLDSRLSEAEDYLARLDELIAAPSDLAALQDLDQERRKTRLEIEHLRQAIETGQTLSRIEIHLASAPAEPSFARAWDDGMEGLEETGAFLIKAGVAGSPILLIGALAATSLRRKRRMLDHAA